MIDKDSPEFYPVVLPVPGVQGVEITRHDARAGRIGGNQRIDIVVKDVAGEPVEGVALKFGLIYGQGVFHPVLSWEAETNARGWAPFIHSGQNRQYELFINGQLLITNLRTDLPWNEYLCPTDVDDWREGRVPASGWVPVNRPGKYGYRIIVVMGA